MTVEALEARLPRPLDLVERGRAETLLGDAEDRVREELGRVGRDLDSEYFSRPGFGYTVDRVIREMVAAAVLIGVNAGYRSVASTTGAESDSATFAGDNPGWGNVYLTEEHKRDLGLPGAARPSGRFPMPWVWPERDVW
ncbi:hypothetical protein CWC39_00855 [Corynebacterium heidelbergense]|uniref:Uncharacterized protein n=1 Tax=Corynebacterium heidelbergense TaxID=2055947 RepID=A0A364VE72_9CORY|nr:hypothetical protein CWC39_00855 [Corynebacterium heidelbergense]